MILSSIKKNRIKQPASSQAGFTILEVIVSVSIIAMISGIFIVNYRYAGQKSKLVLAAQQMASDIRLAQNNSMGTVNIGGAVTNYSWGVHFGMGSDINKKQYTIFTNKTNPDLYRFEAGSESYRTIKLPDGITISAINRNSISVVNSIVIFTPPNPKTYIKLYDSPLDPLDEFSNVAITLKDANSNQTKTVTVNFFGLIDVID